MTPFDPDSKKMTPTPLPKPQDDEVSGLAASPKEKDRGLEPEETASAAANQRTGEANLRTEQANKNTEAANTRTVEANVRTDQANTRADQANLRTEQANKDTEVANTRTVEANVRTDQANTRTEQADLRTGKAEAQSEALRDSETSYRRLFEAARDGILILDIDTGRIADVNPFLVELLGFSRNEMMGKTVGELSPFKDILSNQIMLERLQKEGYVRHENLPLQTRDGRHIAVEFVSNVYQAGDKQVIQCNIRNITERKEVERALQESGRFNRATLDALSAHLAVLDKDGKILATNQAWRDFAELNEADWRAMSEGVNYLTVCEEAAAKGDLDATRTLEGIREVIAALKTTWSFEYPCHSPTEKRWFMCRVTRFPGDGPVRVVVAHENITERKQAEAERTKLEGQYRQAQKMESVGQLAGGIAHDFNNILAVIMMQAEVTGMAEHLPKPAMEGLQEIKAAAERAAKLTRQLLLFSRKQVMQPHQLDLNEVVTSLSQMLRRIIREDVALKLNLTSTPLMVYADAGMLDQMLMNLAVNARDAMPKGGQIVIETAAKVIDAEEAALNPEAEAGRYVWLSVSDVGCGMTPEVQARIFEPFFTTKEVGKGTGLGLATVFGIVKQHHGWLRVYSEVGKGTTFQIYLPASEVPVATALAEMAAKPRPRGGSETILLAEDDSSVRVLTRLVLERSGYHVLEAEDGAEAQQIWSEHQGQIALLLTDLVMPGGMDGRELAADLLNQKPKLKVIFTSGYSAEIAGRELKLEAGQAFIQKPASPNLILETVRICLDA
jgi:two-component system, cell cycle sensor histidine kinase and response regulator CckA